MVTPEPMLPAAWCYQQRWGDLQHVVVASYCDSVARCMQSMHAPQDVPNMFQRCSNAETRSNMRMKSDLAPPEIVESGIPSRCAGSDQ